MSEFDNCEYCTHCMTINDDMDWFCSEKRAVVFAVCERFDHFQGKKRDDTIPPQRDADNFIPQ